MKIILSNTTNISKYLQGNIVYVIINKGAKVSEETNINFRNETNFESFWK